MIESCKYGARHIDGPCVWCERSELRTEVEKLRAELLLMKRESRRLVWFAVALVIAALVGWSNGEAQFGR